jgi:hypothetical protein
MTPLCETDRPDTDCHRYGTQLVIFGHRDQRLLCPVHAGMESAEHEATWVGSGRPRRSR